MIRIGDFSKLSRVSAKTLRYYDEMNLLKPVEVDALTGYRLYEYSQLSILHRILALKDLGFSLEEIGRLLDGDLSVEQMRGMLKLRETEARQRVRDDGRPWPAVGPRAPGGGTPKPPSGSGPHGLIPPSSARRRGSAHRSRRRRGHSHGRGARAPAARRGRARPRARP